LPFSPAAVARLGVQTLTISPGGEIRN
jgi:hypothetical protein